MLNSLWLYPLAFASHLLHSAYLASPSSILTNVAARRISRQQAHRETNGRIPLPAGDM